MIKRMQATGGDYAPFQVRAQEILAAQNILEAATAQKDQRLQAEGLVKAERNVLRTTAANEYRLFYHRLQLEFPTDPELPEMFFMTFTKKPKKEEEE